MDPGTAMMLSAAAAGVGGVFQNASNAREGRANRQFQERMSNTAYQRARKDMEAAGLNPYAMYGGTHPASTPGGAQAHHENVGSTALAAKETAARIELLKAQADKEGALAADARIETDLKSTTGPGEISYRVYRMAQRAHEMGMQPHQLRGAELDAMAKELGLPAKELQAGFARWGNNARRAAERGFSSVSEAGSTFGAWKQAIAATLSSSARSTAQTIRHIRQNKRRPK